MKYKSATCYFDGIKKFKQVGIVLRENHSVDFYYDYRHVETIYSTDNEVFFEIDLSFRSVILKSVELTGKNIKNYTFRVQWKQKIGMSSNPQIKVKSMSSYLEDFAIDHLK